jgi:predicted esterase
VGVPAKRIVLVGFSQGACLSLEYAARHAQRLGGVAALAGRADRGMSTTRATETGSTWAILPAPRCFSAAGMPTRISPKHASARRPPFSGSAGAAVDLRIYPGIGHNIIGDQLDALRAMVSVVREHAGATRTTG